MLKFLLEKKLTNKEHILECIKKVHDWQTASFKEPSVNSFKDGVAKAPSTVATTKDLKLELIQGQVQPNITSINELETYLAKFNLN